MKSAILLLALFAAAFTSCTTAYKTGQTPDDVYYSPLPPREEYVQVDKEEEPRYQYTDEYYDDRYLRMKVSNRYRWNDLNDWYYYERYGFGHNFLYGSYYNPYNSWNYYYNPYCCCYGNNYYSNPKTIAYKPVVKPRAFNLAGYTNTNVSNNNANSSGRINTVKPVKSNVFNNTNNNNGKGLSNTIRTILSNNNNGSSGNSSRTYNPSNSSSNTNSSSSGSSGSSSGSSSGGGVSRPSRN